MTAGSPHRLHAAGQPQCSATAPTLETYVKPNVFNIWVKN